MTIGTCIDCLESSMNIITALNVLRQFLKRLNPDYVHTLNGHDKINFSVILTEDDTMAFYDLLADIINQ